MSEDIVYRTEAMRRADRGVSLLDQLVEAKKEIERLNREGVPGVMHAVDRAFYELAVNERDYERQRYDRLEQRILSARRAEDAS